MPRKISYKRTRSQWIRWLSFVECDAAVVSQERSARLKIFRDSLHTGVVFWNTSCGRISKSSLYATAVRADKTTQRQSMLHIEEDPKVFFYEDPCQNKRCACDATFVSSKISGILEIVAIGFEPALCTEIPCAGIILKRFIYATQVRAHKASHVNENIQQINLPMEKRAKKCPNMPCRMWL